MFLTKCIVNEIEQIVDIADEQFQALLCKRHSDSYLHDLLSAKNMIVNTNFIINKQIKHSQFTLKMHRSLVGLYYISVECNGRNCNFIIDTGAQVTSVFSRLAEQLHLEMLPARLNITSASGKCEKMPGCIMDNFIFGGIEYEKFPMLVMKNMQLFNVVGGVDGILGWDILSGLDFELDDVEGSFKVFENRFKVPTKNLLCGAFPIIIGRDFQNKIVEFGFDSGSKYCWVGKHIMEQSPNLTKRTSAHGWGVHGYEKLDLSYIAQYEIDIYKAHIKINQVHCGRVDMLDTGLIDGVLGNEIFAHRRIRFINSKNVVLIK